MVDIKDAELILQANTIETFMEINNCETNTIVKELLRNPRCQIMSGPAYLCVVRKDENETYFPDNILAIVPIIAKTEKIVIGNECSAIVLSEDITDASNLEKLAQLMSSTDISQKVINFFNTLLEENYVGIYQIFMPLINAEATNIEITVRYGIFPLSEKETLNKEE